MGRSELRTAAGLVLTLTVASGQWKSSSKVRANTTGNQETPMQQGIHFQVLLAGVPIFTEAAQMFWSFLAKALTKLHIKLSKLIMAGRVLRCDVVFVR